MLFFECRAIQLAKILGKRMLFQQKFTQLTNELRHFSCQILCKTVHLTKTLISLLIDLF